MQEYIEDFGRAVFSRFDAVIPNWLMWEIIGIFPVPYLNIIDAETEEEFVRSGREKTSEILEDVKSYQSEFDIETAKVLEIGTGPGRLIVPFAEMAKACAGVDLSYHNLRAAKKLGRKHGVSPTLRRSKAGLPPFSTTFDFVYSVIAFQHMKKRNMLKYLINAHNYLATDGVAYFTFANLNNEENLQRLFDEGLDKTYSFRVRHVTREEVRIYLEAIGYSDIDIVDKGHQIVAMAKK